MRKSALVLALAAACGGPVTADAGMDAPGPPADAGAPLWVELGCTPSPTRPELGTSRFCPSAHDYVGGVVGGELDGAGPWSFCDGSVVPDAGPGCQPADHGWSLVRSCDEWVLCDIGSELCAHCVEWGDDPRGYP